MEATGPPPHMMTIEGYLFNRGDCFYGETTYKCAASGCSIKSKIIHQKDTNTWSAHLPRQQHKHPPGKIKPGTVRLGIEESGIVNSDNTY